MKRRFLILALLSVCIAAGNLIFLLPNVLHGADNNGRVGPDYFAMQGQ